MSWLEGTRKSLSDWGDTQSQGSQAHSAGAQHLTFLQAGSQIMENLLIWLTLWKDEIHELHFLLRKTELYLPSSPTDSQVSQVQVPVKDRPVAQAFPWLPLVGEAPFRGLGKQQTCVLFKSQVTIGVRTIHPNSSCPASHEGSLDYVRIEEDTKYQKGY